MSSAFSSPAQVQDSQIMEETTRGTFEVPGAPAAATFISQTPEIGHDLDMNAIRAIALGTEDPAHIMPTGQLVTFSMLMPSVIPPETITFLKRGVNATVGTGTMDRTFSHCLRLKLGSTQNYLKLKQCLIGAGSLRLVGQGAWTAFVWIQGKLSAFDTSAPTNWTFTTPPTALPIYGKDGGLVTIRDVDTSTDYTPSLRSVSINWNRGLFPIPEIGSNLWADQIPTGRMIRISYVENLKNLQMYDICRLGHQANSTIVLKTATHTFTGTGGILSPVSVPMTMDTPLGLAFNHEVKVGALA